MSAAAAPIGSLDRGPLASIIQLVARNAWVIALYTLAGLLLVAAKAIHPTYGSADIQSLSIGVLPIALAAAAQTVAVVAGGIDLSVGPMMAFTSVVAAVAMMNQSDGVAFLVVAGVLLLGLAAGSINGALVVLTRVPDIIVTLAMSFVWAGAALMVINTPGGRAAEWVKALSAGSFLTEWTPRALVLLVVSISVVWIPLRRSRLGLSMYALGSDRVAALRSGVNVSRTKVMAYAVTGLFAAMGGLAITMNTGIGTPVPGPYTLDGVAAIVLGGVSLAGGRGGMAGPVAAAFILSLVRINLFFLGVDANYSTVVQGALLVVVVMVGAVVALRRDRA